tara:strand:+ start:406 stop:1011 length:606 start_codon:yes stop_codon:yes gene_type:complete
MRWLIPALLVPMVIAGACRGGQSESLLEDADEPSIEVVVSGKGLDPFESAESDIAVGQIAPIVTGLDLLTGETVQIEPAGKPLVVAFFAHWCPHCQREVATLTEWLMANKLPTNVDLIAVSTFEAPERGNHPPKRWLEDEGWKYPVIADTPSQIVADAFGATSVPYFVFVEADGTVAFRMSGNLGPEQLSIAMKRLAGTSI